MVPEVLTKKLILVDLVNTLVTTLNVAYDLRKNGLFAPRSFLVRAILVLNNDHSGIIRFSHIQSA